MFGDALPDEDQGEGEPLFLSLQRNHGSLLPSQQGPAWASGKYGSGLSFDGSDDYVDAGSGSSLDVPDATTSVTVEMWVNLDTGGQTENYPMPYTKGGYGTTVAGYYIGGYADPDRNKMRFGISDGGGTQDDVANSPATVALNDGKWHHLVGYADRTTGKIGLYLDGTLVGENTIPGTVGSLSNAPRSATIGGYGTGFSFKGKIDGVRVYQRALSQAEVQARYAGYLDGEGEATVHYYMGDKEVAFKKGTTLSYIHQDHLSGTSVVSNSSGTLVGNTRYYPYGATRSGSVPTDKQFTGQRLDGTGLYYYGARYYDPSIGRFISADSIVQLDAGAPGTQLALTVSYINTDMLLQLNKLRNGTASSRSVLDPQLLNRYSYGRNNPLAYVDDSGHWIWAVAGGLIGGIAGLGAYALTHRENFNWRDAALWAGGGVLIGATLGAAASYVAPMLVTTTTAAGGGAAVTQRGLSGFSRAAEFGIGTYNELAKLTAHSGLRVHHLIEERFAKLLGVKADEIPSIVLTPEEHQALTNAWRQLIGHIGDLKPLTTANVTIEHIWAAAQRIYADHPGLLEALRQYLGK